MRTKENKDELIAVWTEIQKEARKLTEAGYGNVRFVKGKGNSDAED